MPERYDIQEYLTKGTLSEQGNPELASLDRLLHAVGLRLAVEVDRTGVDSSP